MRPFLINAAVWFVMLLLVYIVISTLSGWLLFAIPLGLAYMRPLLSDDEVDRVHRQFADRWRQVG